MRGYDEEGTTTTPFDMAVLNELDRFHLALEAINRLPNLGEQGIQAEKHFRAKLKEHRTYIVENGEDMPEIREWRWQTSAAENAGG